MDTTTQPSLETLLTALAEAALWLGLGWLALVTLAAVVEALTGVGTPVVRAVTPAALRRVVAISCGLALSSGPALAAVTDDTSSVLDGLPVPDRPTGVTLTEHTAAREPARSAPSTYEVRTGDSLWTITERLLPPSATTAQVDDGWRTIYRANRSRVGHDPDLLRPGAVLHLPAQLQRPSLGDGTPIPAPQRKERS
jgi:nucleoid-associated protein YgaU